MGIFRKIKKKLQGLRRKSISRLNTEQNKIVDLAEKEKLLLRQAEKIDEKIEKIQISSKTLLPIAAPLHAYFRMKWQWYRKWHEWKHAVLVHWLILILILIFGLIFGLNYAAEKRPEKIARAANACQSNGTGGGNWNAAGSWTSCGSTTPQTVDSVTIVSGDTITLNVTGTVVDVTINAGGNLTVSTTNVLNVAGNFSNAGIFIPSTGTVDFTKSSGTQTVDNGVSRFYNMIHSGAGTAQLTSTAWPYSKQITIDKSVVSNTDQSNFPYLVSLATDAGLAAHACTNGYDIAFVDSSGAKLSHEIEKYVTATGELLAWVKITTLSASVNTVITMYYGNTGCVDQQDSINVWSNSYYAVWHMDEAASPIADAVSAKAGTQSGGVTFSATGKIGPAASHDGIDDKINLGAIVIPTTGTMSFWWQPNETVTGTVNHMMFRSYIASPFKLFDFVDYNGTIYAGWYNNGNDKRVSWAISGISSGTWYYVTLNWTNAGSVNLYVNSVARGTPKTSLNATFDTSTASNNIANDPTAAPQQYAKMAADEFRISSSARSADWITTEYRNQNAPATYQTLGSELSTNITGIANNLTNSAGTIDLNSEGIGVGATFSNDNGTLKLIGDETVTLTNDSTHGTIEYSATSGTRAIKTMTYNNISLSGSGGTYTLPAATTINGTLTVVSGAILSLNSQNLTLATLSNSGTVKLQGTETVTVTTPDVDSGVIEYIGTGTYSSLVFGSSYYSLKLNGSGAIWTLSADLTVAGVLEIAAGTLIGSTKTITLSGSGTPLVITGTFMEKSSTIQYTGSTATNILGTTYFNLKFNQTGTTFTAAGNMTILGVLTIQAGEFDASSRTITLFGGGNSFVNSGTFTPSTSTVLYNNSVATNVLATTYNNLSFTTGSPYKRSISISNSTGATLTDHQVKVTLSSSNFSFASSTSDGHDLRFIGSDGSNLSYFIESWSQGGATGVVWVKVPSISTSGVTVDLYYGDSALAAQSNGINTFELYDPFDSLANWTQSGTSISVASGVATLDSGTNPKIYRTFSVPQPFTAEVMYQKPSNYRNRLYLTTAASPTTPTGYDYGDFSGSLYWNGFTGVVLSDNTWYTVRWDNTTTNYTWSVVDSAGSTVLTRSYGSAIANLARLDFSGTENTSSDLKLDWVRIRKYASTEPGATVGSETATAGAWTFAGNATINGDLTINSGTVLGSTHTISVKGDWLNSSTFTKDTSTVTFSGTGAQSVTAGGSDFNNLTVTNASVAGVTFVDSIAVTGTFTNTTADSKVTFNSGSDYDFNAININGGAIGTRITLTSSSAGVPWNLNITAGSPSAAYVSVKDSNANKDIDATTGGYDATGNTHWLFPAGENSAPTNDSLTFTNPYSTNVAIADDTTEWNFTALVSDTNGTTNLQYVELRLANSTDSTQAYDSLKFRWTENGDSFSEEADTQAAATLTSTSADTSPSGNQWTLNFKVKLNGNFTTTDTQYAAELYAVDDSAATDTDNYVNKFQVTPLFVTLDVDSPTLVFGNLIPGNILTGTTVVTVSTNFGNGYSLSVSDDTAASNSALLHQIDASTRIADYAGTITTPTLWTGSGLGICLFSATGKAAKWGTGTTETDENNKYAGVPQNATVMHAKTGSPTTNDSNSVGYKLVVPTTQKTGDYSGDIIYTATGTLE